MRLTKMVLHRIGSLAPTLFGISIIVFGLVHFSPGDPAVTILGSDYTPEAAEQLRDELGFNDPLIVQYFDWLWGVVRGDFGRSIYFRTSVATLLLSRLPVTVTLAMAALFVSLAVGMTTGVLAAVFRDSWVDSASRSASLLGVSLPVYVWGIVLLAVFSVRLGWFPSGGTVVGLSPRAYMLPAIALGSVYAGFIARTTRAAMLDQLTSDYVRGAYAKGLRKHTVVLNHALRASLAPVITVAGLQLGYLLGGAVITELIFSLPGIGRLMIDSILARDYPVIQGSVLLVATAFVFANLLTDLATAALDKRLTS